MWMISPSRWLTALLAAGFFAPPIAMGAKKVFLIDLLFYAWPLYYLLRRRGDWAAKNARPALWWALGAATMMAAVYIHGQVRMDLRHQLAGVQANAIGGQSFSPFSWLQDGIIFSRFLSWVLAAALLWADASVDPAPWKKAAGVLARNWGLFAAIEGVVAILGFYDPVRPLLGHVYGYDPEYLSWRHRAHGTFSSPVELGATMLPGVLYWFLQLRRGVKIARIPLALSILGLTLSGSYSALMGLSAALLFHFRKIFGKRPALVATLAGGAVLFAVFLTFAAGPLADRYPWFEATGMQTKVPNLLFRLEPWCIFLKGLLSRFDYLLLGMGFARSHSDNGYLQILRAGGLALLIPYLAFVFRRRAWEPWAQMSCMALLVAALTIDATIFRVTGPMLLIILSIRPKNDN